MTYTQLLESCNVNILLKVKFPTEYGVGVMKGDQVLVCECY